MTRAEIVLAYLAWKYRAWEVLSALDHRWGEA